MSRKFKKKRKRNFELSSRFHFSHFRFFSTRLALWCEVSEKSIATSPDVAHNFFFFHGYVYPRINGNSHKPSSPGVGHKYICAYFRSWSQFCGLATGCTTYPSGKNAKIRRFFSSFLPSTMPPVTEPLVLVCFGTNNQKTEQKSGEELFFLLGHFYCFSFKTRAQLAVEKKED